MTEKLLQFIWQFQYYNQSWLKTITGEELEIIFAGQLNVDQGPDFVNARIRIGTTMLAGSIELHLKTSQWKAHGHDEDVNYRNVILHVVYEHDIEGATGLPVLELQSRIAQVLLERYNSLMNSGFFIPCAASIASVKELTWLSWKERLLAERLTRKSELLSGFLAKTNDHWEESFWWLLARNFGTRVNSDAFEAIAASLPLTVLTRHKHQIQQVEALLFGQANLLNRQFSESYPKLLSREYVFLKKKYGLRPISLPVHFLRMRPGNFPTIRLAQLAALLEKNTHLFSRIIETEKISEVSTFLEVTANDYWHYHYMFDEPSAFRMKTIGKDMIDNLVVNTLVPVLFSYGLYHKEEKFRNRALEWLEETGPESNSITKNFTRIGIANKSAYDSQALIELNTRYCNHRHCLNCAIGNAILKT